MPSFGYKLMSEEHGPRALVENARRAERLGFDFVAISDHFFPWLDAQGVVTAIGPDQDAFFGFWESELRPRVERLRGKRAR